MSKTMTEKKPTKEKGFNYKGYASDVVVRKALENMGFNTIDRHNISIIADEINKALVSIDMSLPEKELKTIIEANSSRGASAIAYMISKACGNYS